MSVTLSLAMSMRRMLLSNNLVRKMHATETMGATTVICTDKTGTLTQNQMRVAATNFVGLVNQDLDQSDEGAIIKDNAYAEKSILIKESISINSTAFLDFSNLEKIKTLGNPTEAALLLWLHGPECQLSGCPRRGQDSGSAYILNREKVYGHNSGISRVEQNEILYVKGAPEIVMSKCKDVPDGIHELLLQYQNQAMRTLGFAYKEVTKDINHSIEDLAKSELTYLGVVAISDPVREDVPDAVARCLRAGIDVKIVTGDTPGTAMEIGRKIGILSADDGDAAVITGVDFEKLTDEEALGMVLKLKIMCRARPSDKQRLVQLLQKTGAVVAVTGDGTNDAPALNHAHVGLSMGTGTSVAKEASDITLLDDSFNSIATAVMWGPVVISEYPEIYTVPAHNKCICIDYCLAWLHVWAPVAFDCNADALGEPYHGHLCCGSFGFSATKQQGDGEQTQKFRRLHNHPFYEAKHPLYGCNVCFDTVWPALFLYRSIWRNFTLQPFSVLYHFCDVAVLEHVQCKNLRSGRFSV